MIKALHSLCPIFIQAATLRSMCIRKNIQNTVNSIYGTADLGYKNQVFCKLNLDVMTVLSLDPNNNHYFYPSIGMSWVFSEYIQDSPTGLLSEKVRASYAAASNGTKAYQNLLTY